MKVVASAPGASAAVDLQAVVRAERDGVPFLLLRDGEGAQIIVVLEKSDERLWIGRDPDSDVVLDWDDQVSRTHAELERAGGGWTVSDDGLSRNGTFVDGERVSGSRRLRDRQALRVGGSSITYRAPGRSGVRTTPGDTLVAAPDLTPMQRKVLAALCRPAREAPGAALPATNRGIAEELVLSVDGVKTHMRALFARFGVEDLPQNRKRARLMELALQAGLGAEPRAR